MSHAGIVLKRAYRLSSTYPTLCFKDIGISKNGSTSIWKSDAKKFRHVLSTGDGRWSLICDIDRSSAFAYSTIGPIGVKQPRRVHRRHVLSTTTDDLRLIFALGVQVCEQRDECVMQRVARVCLRQLRLVKNWCEI